MTRLHPTPRELADAETAAYAMDRTWATLHAWRTVAGTASKPEPSPRGASCGDPADYPRAEARP